MRRRDFIAALAAVTSTRFLTQPVDAKDRDRLGDLLPQRPLGRTGVAVTMLGVGGWHIGRMSERDAEETIETAIEGGVRFFDSAESYQRGGSESRLGKLLVPKYREDVFLMTKTTADDASTARRHLADSLKRLRTDYLDLWQVHSVNSRRDVDERLSAGVLDVMQEAKASGKVRHIGFTGHKRTEAHLHVLESTDAFETCQMPINVVDPSYDSFILNVLPKLTQRDVGVIAMKTLSNGGFFGGSRHGQHGDKPHLVPERLSIREALHFAWSLPVGVVVTGPDNPSQMREKIALAQSFKPMDVAARQQLVERVADMAGRSVEFYKA